MANKRASDWSSLFPPGKIKAQLTRDDEVGRLSQKTIQLISISSALFVKQIVGKATESKQNQALTLLSIRDATAPFLHDVLGGISEESAPKRIRKTTVATKENRVLLEKSQSSKFDESTLNRVVEETAYATLPSQMMKVIEDDEDYD
jgi:hypothetical protein